MDFFKLNFILSYTFTGTILLFLAVFVYSQKPRSIIKKTFSIYTLSISWWSLFSVPMLCSTSAAQATFWDRICLIGAVFIPATFIHFNYVFLGVERQKNIIVKLCYIISFCFCITLFTPFFIKGTEIKSVGVYFSKPSMLYSLFIFYFFSISIFGIFRLFQGTKNAVARSYHKKQVSFLFWATLLGYTGGGFNYNLVFDIPPYNIIPFGNYAIGIYVMLVSYSIIRHRLLDIEVIIRKTLVFTGLFVVSYGIFAGFAYLGSVFFENIVQNRWIAMLPSVFVIVLILRPIEFFLRNATDKYLFQKKYDYRELLKAFSGDVLTVLDFKKLSDTIVNKLDDIIKLKNVAMLLYNEDTETFEPAAITGDTAYFFTVSNDDDIISYMRRTGSYLSSENAEDENVELSNLSKKIKDIRSALMIPLTHQSDMVGILSLGEKKSDEEFTQDDIDILVSLSRTLSIAIINARLFEELSKAQAQAAQREKMAVIGTLSAGINHEICNPLGIARGQCEMFLLNMADGIYKDKTPEELLAKSQDIMNKVIHETDRATGITRKLSSFAKPAKGEVSDGVNITDELEEVIALVEHEMKLDNIGIKKEIKKGIPLISADRKQVQEILFNLIRNAGRP